MPAVLHLLVKIIHTVTQTASVTRGRRSTPVVCDFSSFFSFHLNLRSILASMQGRVQLDPRLPTAPVVSHVAPLVVFVLAVF